MTNNDCLPAHLLQRKAVVYVRQSTQTQVLMNIESQRRQYELVEEAKRRGFHDIDIIDDDLGVSVPPSTYLLFVDDGHCFFLFDGHYFTERRGDY